jgi:hypothetical protein
MRRQTSVRVASTRARSIDIALFYLELQLLGKRVEQAECSDNTRRGLSRPRQSQCITRKTYGRPN